jgi:hypothetical protein
LQRTLWLSNLACTAACNAEVEGQYLADVAKRRWPVLVFVFSFDVGCYLLRLGAKLLSGHQGVTPVGLIHNLSPQLANMAFCYLFLTYVNRRSRRLGNKAARQVRCCARRLLGWLHIISMPCCLGLVIAACRSACSSQRTWLGSSVCQRCDALCGN